MFSFQCYKLDPLNNNKSMTHSLNTELKISMADSCNCGKQVILLVPGNKKKKPPCAGKQKILHVGKEFLWISIPSMAIIQSWSMAEIMVKHTEGVLASCKSSICHEVLWQLVKSLLTVCNILPTIFFNTLFIWYCKVVWFLKADQQKCRDINWILNHSFASLSGLLKSQSSYFLSVVLKNVWKLSQASCTR